jgi:hypothetical protein
MNLCGIPPIRRLRVATGRHPARTAPFLRRLCGNRETRKVCTRSQVSWGRGRRSGSCLPSGRPTLWTLDLREFPVRGRVELRTW